MGHCSGTADLVPKPVGQLPIMVTGGSRQPLEWIAAHSDGWITYPRSLTQQAEMAAQGGPLWQPPAPRSSNRLPSRSTLI